MVKNDIFTLVNAAAKQAYGLEAPAVKDSTGLVQLKSIVFSSATNKDLMYQALTDVIFRTRFEGKVIKAVDRYVMQDNAVFNEYRRIIKLGVNPDATEDPQWDSNTQASPFDVEMKEKGLIIEKIFGGVINPYTFETSYPEDQMFSAFDSAAQMKGFVALIYQRMEQQYETAKENLAKLASNTAYAAVYADGVATQKLHLVTEYNAFRGTSLTRAQIYASQATLADYFDFSAGKIMQLIDDMKTARVDFNVTAGESVHYLTASSGEDLVVEAIGRFIQNIGSFAKSEYFHNEYIQLPKHTTLNCWDALDATHSDASRYKIQVQNDEINEGEAVTIENLVMVLRSDKLIASIIDKPEHWAMYNPRARRMNMGESAAKAYYADLSENCVLVLED